MIRQKIWNRGVVGIIIYCCLLLIPFNQSKAIGITVQLAAVYEITPPVEKNRKAEKTDKRQKRKFARKLRKAKKQQDAKTTWLILGLVGILLILILGGVFAAIGHGMLTATLWYIGLSFLASAEFMGLLFGIIGRLVFNKREEVSETFSLSYGLFMGAFIAVNLLMGFGILLWGLLGGGYMLWILGILILLMMFIAAMIVLTYYLQK